ncbi:hypothetical protein BUALT_Bualt16G0065500 [Buddleja alternifolia]|uniref:Galactose oxidase n=1 Tax=Buddleja alternifolia TaxID=168488 RepID=A0AAV6WK88_9LAMI|nr:hypothetical protein BUALT_Bualt16G0065500 [Buddleja alternifolia]
MALFFKSLIVLSLFIGFSAATVRPSAVNRYSETDQTPAPPSEEKNAWGIFGRLPFKFPWFGQKPPGENDKEIDEGAEEVGFTQNLGSWRIDSENAGVSAMHIQLMPNNKAVWYDSTSNGLSDIELNPRSCKPRFGGKENDPEQDCTAHGIEYDIETAEIRTLKVDTSPWCSSGGLSRNGDLVSTGGDKDGFRAVRILKPCKNCDFQENSRALYLNRWYATQHALEDGSFIVMGGRNAYNYEIIPPDSLEFTPSLVELPLLEESSDDGGRENNLYPFVNLLPDGNLFVFANYKSIILNPYTGETVRQLPDLPGGSRNYPPSGMSALLPINLDIDENGNTREAYTLSDLQQPKRTFLPALNDCGRLNLNRENAQWEKENMPSERVMGDMLLLPTGDVLMINGAKKGTSAWDAAADPNLTPVLYSPNKEKGKRFEELKPSGIPRMYHSVSAVLPNAQILVAGSNTNAYYKLPHSGEKYTYPTELRVEKFSPPYLAPGLDKYRLEINEGRSDKGLKYGNEFTVEIEIKKDEIKKGDIKVTMYSPPFTTHGYSMNQRLLILKISNVDKGKITVVAPPSGKLAPPGYYLLFVVHHDVPSRGIWVQIQ